jgi:hypothetical protein
MGLTAVVTLLTPPDAWSILQRFYLAARPLGAWRPVADRISQDPIEARADNSHHDERAAAAGAGLILLGLALALSGIIHEIGGSPVGQ